MSYRRLAAFPLVWLAFFLLVVLLVPAEGRAPYLRVGNEASKTIAALGCLVAAYTFARGDYMRRAWALNAGCYVLLLGRDVFSVFAPPGSLLVGPIQSDAVRGVLALLANVSALWGTLLLARAWSIAGLELPGSRRTKLGIIVVVALSAVGASGTGLVLDGRAFLGGDFARLQDIASDLGDVFGLCLLAPMLLTALAMSGGVLRWPWGLLTASVFFWLLYDVATTFDHVVPGHEAAVSLTRECFRALACACECSAGFAQRRAVTEPEEAAGERS